MLFSPPLLATARELLIRLLRIGTAAAKDSRSSLLCLDQPRGRTFEVSQCEFGFFFEKPPTLLKELLRQLAFCLVEPTISSETQKP